MYMCSINHDLKVIYIHIPKAGGCYVEDILREHYGFTLDYLIKNKNYGFIDDPNTFILPVKHKGAFRFYINSDNINKTYNMTEEKWNTYYKFTFVRNPYTRIISAYEFFRAHYAIVIGDNIDFPIFIDFIRIIKNGIDDPFYINRKHLYFFHYYHFLITQYDHIINNDNIIDINFIGKTEVLNSDLIEVLKKLNIKEYTKHIEEIKTNNKINCTRKKVLSYYYTEETLVFINNHFDKDFKYFGYKKANTVEELEKNIDLLNEYSIFKEQNQILLNKLCSEK